MGFNNEFGAPVLFDLETIAHERAGEFLPPPDFDLLTPPKNYTKLDTIARWREEEKARRVKAYEDELVRCALDPDLNRIVAIGAIPMTDHAPRVLTCCDEYEEREALRVFWNHIGPGSSLVGFNIVHFDMPTLLRRSKLLGVPHPAYHLARYRHPGVVDLMKLLSFDGVLTMRSQRFYLRRFGLDVPVDTVDGGDIAQLVSSGQWDVIAHHVRCDVLGVQALAEWLGVIDAVNVEVL